jgi:hypothetical protein
MPASLFASTNINLKPLRLLAIVLLTPLTFYAQQLTGLWIGTLSNDSNTVRKDQSFEVALTEYRGKVYGYSRSEFIVNDTLYYVVKRVKGTIIGDMCEVKDDEIISFNFPTKLDKGVKVVSTFFRNKIDSTWYLAGKWKTNKTKNYYSVSGTVDLAGETDLTRSKIFPHLEELKLTKDVAFYEESKKEPPSIVKIRQVVADKKTTAAITIDPQSTTSITTSLPKDIQSEIVKPAPAFTKAIPANTETEKPSSLPVTNNNSIDAFTEIKEEPKKNAIKAEQQVAVNKPSITTDKPANIENENTSSVPVAKNDFGDILPEIKKEPQKIATTKTEQQTNINKPTIAVAKPDIKSTIPEVKKPDINSLAKTTIKKGPVDINSPAAFVDERKSEFTQEVTFKSDSLEISLYDNAQVDGDTVSVLLNGEVIIAKQVLKATAFKKTIYIPAGSDELSLVLYAENLGKYPPNTGLMVVHDGDDVYQVRFSADLQKNAGVIFRKKKN